jgi:endonuclease/exonuclease/phosphatase family metal-dependent hydrolase
MTYNIWDGGLGRLSLVEAVIRAQSPDVVALQEVTDRGAAEGLAARLGLHYVHGDANSRFDIAWLSRRPVARAENHRLPELAKTLLEIELDGVRLFATHLVHGRDVAAGRARLREVDAIGEVLAHVGPPHVLVGDLNAVHPDDELGEPDEPLEHVSREPVARLLESGHVDAFRAANPDAQGWTYTTRQPWARLDHVLVQGLAVRACEVVTAAPAREASDHFPVVADVD